jgi:hypothetical protein
LWVIFALLDPDPYSNYGSGSGSTLPIEYGSGSGSTTLVAEELFENCHNFNPSDLRLREPEQEEIFFAPQKEQHCRK